MPDTVHLAVPFGIGQWWTQVQKSQLVRQNSVLFVGGFIAGVGSLAFHAIAGRVLGPSNYGQVASLTAIYAVAAAPAVILTIVLARHAATLGATEESIALRSLTSRTISVVGIAGLLAISSTALIGSGIAAFDHLTSTTSVLITGISVALVWLLAIPRGILQGLQRFGALALNLSVDVVVRTSFVLWLLIAGFAVSGAMTALAAGLACSVGLGLFSIRDRLRHPGIGMPLRSMVGFSATAAAALIGVQILYNQDLILAEHFLSNHAGGIYGGLNKVGGIVYFLTLSVSQVLFPRVVEAVAKNHHPGRLLVSSAGIVVVLAASALLIFAATPRLMVGIVFGSSFGDAVPYVVPMGVIGLALSLNNLLIQFLMAVHDRVFLVIVGAGCIAEGALITAFHAGPGQVVTDVLVTLLALLACLILRCYAIWPSLGSRTRGAPVQSFF